MNKVITFTDAGYFKYGKPFRLTRSLTKADVICYGHDLTKDQILELEAVNIEYKEAPSTFNTKMQFLKFDLLMMEMTGSGHGLTFMDFDTLILNDWQDVYEDDFDFGVTVRHRFVAQKILRAYANGGVILAKDTDNGKRVCEFAVEVMQAGGHESLPEYDKIYKTLEEGRPAHKTHKRENLCWWVDQVFLSSLVYRYMNKEGKRTKTRDYVIWDDLGFRIGIFNCDRYNHLDPGSGDLLKLRKAGVKILHLKNKGRESLRAFERALYHHAGILGLGHRR